MTQPDTLLEPLLAELEAEFDGLQVVALGGGHGLAQALMAIQAYAGAITAIVSVADDGGSSGRLSPDLGIPPPGDLRRALVALSPDDSVWKQLLEYRFESADVSGHSLGNLVLAALADLSDFQAALDTAGRLLGARGAVVAVCEEALHLEAVIGGETIKGQVAVATARGRLTELRLEPPGVPASDAALRAISAAQQIVIGPGSLFTSTAANLKVGGVAEAINGSKAQLVYVCNLTTQDGETLGFDAYDHLDALSDHAGLRWPDVVVAHEGDIDVPSGLQQVGIDTERIEERGGTVQLAHLVDPDGDWPQHEPGRLGAVLRRLA